jgi:hypothetical protein
VSLLSDDEDDVKVKTEELTSAFRQSSIQPTDEARSRAPTTRQPEPQHRRADVEQPTRTTSSNVPTNAAAVSAVEYSIMAAFLKAQEAYANGCEISKEYGDYKFTIILERRK